MYFKNIQSLSCEHALGINRDVESKFTSGAHRLRTYFREKVTYKVFRFKKLKTASLSMVCPMLLCAAICSMQLNLIEIRRFLLNLYKTKVRKITCIQTFGIVPAYFIHKMEHW